MRTNTYFVQFQVADIPELENNVFTFAKTIIRIPDDPDLAGQQIMELIYSECLTTIKAQADLKFKIISPNQFMFMIFSLIDSFPNPILSL